jgi:hypothetical protein
MNIKELGVLIMIIVSVSSLTLKEADSHEQYILTKINFK